jgi:large subunit ribosomal protein L17
MRHHIYGRRLSRTTNERKALFRSLAIALFTHGRIDTTEAKAKAVRPWVEKLVTRSKSHSLTSRRLLLSDIPNQQIVDKLITSIGPVFSERPGGYTRLTRLGNRFGDNAMIVRLEFVDEIKDLRAAVLTKKEKLETKEYAVPAKDEKTDDDIKKTRGRRLAKKEAVTVEK